MIRKFILLSVLLCSAEYTCSQNYNAKVDTLWGNYCYREVKGNPDRGTARQKQALSPWPSDSRTKMVYYVRIPSGKVKAEACLTTKAGKTASLDLVLTAAQSGDTLLTHTATASDKGKFNRILLIPDMAIANDTWYRLELSCKSGGSTIASFEHILFYRESRNAVVPSEIFMAPSTHLWTWSSSYPDAPKGESYDWCYQEVMMPSEWERVNTYAMSLGILSGYMGIQSVSGPTNSTYNNFNHNVLFSMWDNGDVDKDPNLPEYLKSGALDAGKNVAINRFRAEGTGVQAMMSNGSFWEPDNWVQFIACCRPENIDVSVVEGGKEKVIKYQNTIVTAWYKMAKEKEWHYIATHRESGKNHYFSGWYSFLENFSDLGGNLKHRAYFRKGYMRSMASGKWYNRNGVTYGHTQGTGERNSRNDYGHGASTFSANCFYLESGGYGDKNDSANYVPLAVEDECVDTINLSALLDRVDQAVIKDKSKEIESMLSGISSLEGFKGMASSLIQNANTFNNYAIESLSELATVYAGGTCTDATSLKSAIENVGKGEIPLKYSVVQSKENIGTFRSYQLYNANGLGVVCGTIQDDIKMLTVGKEKNDATSPMPFASVTNADNNWMIIRSERYNKYYLFNMGLGMYLDLSQGTLLSETPVPVVLTLKSSGLFYISQGSYYLCVNPSSQTGTITRSTSKTNVGCTFEIRDNIAMQPDEAKTFELLNVVEQNSKNEETLSTLSAYLNLSEGTVGGFRNEADKQAIRDIYNGGKYPESDKQRLLDAVNKAPRLELEPGAKLYRFRNATETYAKIAYLAVARDSSLSNGKSTYKPEQLWQLKPTDAGGYVVCSQGTALNNIPTQSNIKVRVAPKQCASNAYVSPLGVAKYAIGAYSYAPYGIRANTATGLTCAETTVSEAQWYIEEAPTAVVSIGQSGVTAYCADFDFVLKEDLEAYIGDGIDENGTLTLKKLSGDTVFARTPVILKGNAGKQYNVAILPPSATTGSGVSVLRGTLLTQSNMESGSYFILSTSSIEPIMVPSSTKTIAMNQVYVLRENVPAGLEQLTLKFSGATDVKVTVADKDTEGVDYDLSGRRATQNTKGIIINKERKEWHK